MNSRGFDHIDLRVRSLEEAVPFYEKFLPALGFSRLSRGDGWRTFSLAQPDPTEFIWLVEAPSHQPNETRIAMWVDSRAEVDRVAELSSRPADGCWKGRSGAKITVRITTPVFSRIPAAIAGKSAAARLRVRFVRFR